MNHLRLIIFSILFSLVIRLAIILVYGHELNVSKYFKIDLIIIAFAFYLGNLILYRFDKQNGKGK